MRHNYDNTYLLTSVPALDRFFNDLISCMWGVKILSRSVDFSPHYELYSLFACLVILIRYQTFWISPAECAEYFGIPMKMLLSSDCDTVRLLGNSLIFWDLLSGFIRQNWSSAQCRANYSLSLKAFCTLYPKPMCASGACTPCVGSPGSIPGSNNVEST